MSNQVSYQQSQQGQNKDHHGPQMSRNTRQAHLGSNGSIGLKPHLRGERRSSSGLGGSGKAASVGLRQQRKQIKSVNKIRHASRSNERSRGHINKINSKLINNLAEETQRSISTNRKKLRSRSKGCKKQAAQILTTESSSQANNFTKPMASMCNQNNNFLRH